MKTRCFDHIDLRVTNMETAGKVYGENIPHIVVDFPKTGDNLTTKDPAASRTCHFAGCTPCSVSQADRAFQNRQGRAAACAWRFTAFSEREDSLDGCVVELDRR